MRLIFVLLLLFQAAPDAAASAFNLKRILSSQTKTESQLVAISRDIAKLAVAGDSSGRNDRKVEKLYTRGRAIWARSPANSRTTFSVSGGARYEVDILIQAMVDYYTVTARTGTAIPYLVDASEEALGLRYYTHWRLLTIQLVGIYHRLGMLDHANERLMALLNFMERLGFSMDEMPGAMDADAVVFAQVHALRLTTDPDAYSPAQVKSLFQFFLRSVEEAPAAWGWDPRVGFTYVRYVNAFLQWFAQSGDRDQFDNAVAEYTRLRQRNESTDPLALADELNINFLDSQLGRDLFLHLNARFSHLTNFSHGISDLPPEQSRYLVLSTFQSALELSEAYQLIDLPEQALAQIARAMDEIDAIDTRYQSFPAGLRELDLISLDRMRLTLVTAHTLEALGRPQEALQNYRTHITWSERERASLPLEERLHFFRGQARGAYLGAIRATADIYDESGLAMDFDRLIASVESLRSRQFEEALGRTESRPDVSVKSVRSRLDEKAGVLVLQDVGTELLTLLVTHRDHLLGRITKPDDWDEGIFRLRNKLAQEAHYDADGFDQIGGQLLAPAAHLIDDLERLYVINDGAVSSLPPSILPYREGMMLADQVAITLLPSLSVWMSADVASEIERPPSLFVVADPVFDQRLRIENQVGKEMMATRGSTALSYFTQLPETLDEGRTIAQHFAERSRLVHGADAVESLIKSEPLDSFTHLHFATHGIISNDLPGFTEPALVLGYEEGEDGFLFASEVSDLKLDAKLTVLSACNTGNGEYFNGEGLMGMGRAFMLAGSDNVIVSLWPVESYSTQQMMERLYGHMATGLSPADALREAQRDIRGGSALGSGERRGIEVSTGGDEQVGSTESEYNNPFYWSPFLLISTE